ncbi:MAG: S1 RNA-binding domain-containing protein [Anaerolineaceae bacterium]|nr:MAG: S1 RNA-binding domain-containing protein [Anaerolineaceae bacterium]
MLNSRPTFSERRHVRSGEGKLDGCTTSMSANTQGAEGKDEMEQPTPSAEEQVNATPPVEAEATPAEVEAEAVPAETEATSAETEASATPAETEAEAAPAETEASAAPAEIEAESVPAETEASAVSADDPPARFKRGDLLEGTIVSTAPTLIEVDLGDGAQGIVPGKELDRLQRDVIGDLNEVGATVTVYVVNPRDHNGNVVLSINRAIEELDWRKASEYSGSGQVYEGNIAGYNKGGLIVRFGRLRGFVPQSQIGDVRRRQISGETPEERYSGMVNDPIFVKVMEVDQKRNRLILSERAAAREVREQRKSELIEELEVGQVIEGKVVSLEDFGAFVDVGGAEGLVHLTEITWKHITHPREALSVGQTVKVEVISVDRDRKRIGLSVRRQEADPWDEVATTYQVGDLVQAVITKMTKFGAFASLTDAEEIEGLVHISELSEDRVAHPRDMVTEGEKLTLRVVKIDVKNRRLGLSLKRVNSSEYLDRDLQAFVGGDATGDDES